MILYDDWVANTDILKRHFKAHDSSSVNDAMVMKLRSVSIVYQRYQLREITESLIFGLSGPTIVDNERTVSHR